jgi:ADP-ribose pyrophosphatase
MNDGEMLERRPVFDGKVVKLSVDTVRLPNGHVTELEMIEHPGAAAVVPVDQVGNVLLVHQYRYATGGWLLEIPAGKLDGDELPESCAVREVEEETGYKPTTLTPLGWIWTTPGFTDEKIWLYLATDLENSQQALQDNEVLSVKRMPLEQATEMATTGEIVDAKSIIGLLRAAQLLRDQELWTTPDWRKKTGSEIVTPPERRRDCIGPD